VSDEVRRARDFSYNPGDPADLWENITPVSPAEFGVTVPDDMITVCEPAVRDQLAWPQLPHCHVACGGHLTAAPDSQYGTLWTCDLCGLAYADDEDETR
jgi:hypothetical protein